MSLPYPTLRRSAALGALLAVAALGALEPRRARELLLETPTVGEAELSAPGLEGRYVRVEGTRLVPQDNFTETDPWGQPPRAKGPVESYTLIVGSKFLLYASDVGPQDRPSGRLERLPADVERAMLESPEPTMQALRGKLLSYRLDATAPEPPRRTARAVLAALAVLIVALAL